MLHCDGKLPRQMYRLSTSITFRQLVLLYVDKVFVGLLSGGLQGTSSYLCEAPLPGEGTLKIYIYIYIYIYICRMNPGITFIAQRCSFGTPEARHEAT